MVEATGVGRVVFDAMAGTAPYGIVCLTGVSSGGRRIPVDAGATNRELVLENDVVIGSVNANLRHYAAAAAGAGRGRPGLAGTTRSPGGCRWAASPRRYTPDRTTSKSC